MQVAQGHAVQFYETEAHLSQVVSEHLGQALANGASAVIIATPEHTALFVAVLRQAGFDPEALARAGRLLQRDARETLASFMSGPLPDERRFAAVVAGLLRLLPEGQRRGARAYGEMVDLLLRDGNNEGALRLEELWNAVCEQHGLALLCAYDVAVLRGRSSDVQRICAAHAHIEAPEGLGGSPGESAGPLALIEEITRRRQSERALMASLDELGRTEAALRASEGQLQAVADALPTLISYIDADGHYRFVNASYERWFGRSKEDTVGKHVIEVVGEEAYEAAREHVERALAGRVVTFQSYMRYRDGEPRFVEATLVPRLGADGKAQGFSALVADITERRQEELAREAAAERTARLMKVTVAIADAVTEEQVYEAVVDRVAHAIGAATAGLWRLDDAGEAAVHVRSLGYSELTRANVMTLRLDEPSDLPLVRALRTGQPVMYGSRAEVLASSPQVGTWEMKAEDYRLACLPIIVRGRPLGALAFTFEDDPAGEQSERDFLLLIARYAGQAIERVRLLESERKSRADAEAAAARLGVLSRASRHFTEAGDDLDALLRATVEDVSAEWADGCAVMLIAEGGAELQLDAAEHRIPEAVTLMRTILTAKPLQLSEDAVGSARVAMTGEPLIENEIDLAEALATAAPQVRSWLERYAPRAVAIVPLRARGKIVGVLIAVRQPGSPSFTDEDGDFLQELADRAGLAIESSRLHRENQQGRLRAELLYGLARAVIAAEHAGEVFDAALDAIERALGTGRTSILTYDADGVMRFRAWRGLSERYRAAVEGHSPWARDARSPEPVLVRDVEADPDWAAFLPLLQAEGIRALGFIPLVAAGRLIGKFMVYYDTPRDFGRHELDMASAIANHVAAAVARFDAIGELQRTVRFNEMFTGILGHDLRNPLGAIMTSAQLLQMRGEGEKLARPLGRIMNSGQRMARMIDQLLDFTRVRVGEGIPIVAKACDVLSLVREVMAELDEANPDCALHLEHLGDARGVWDADRLSQVFSNLVANAVQHGDPGHGVRVHVDGSAVEHVVITVHNMGAVPASLLPRLFEPMAGGDRRRDQSQGLGLGLYVSREILRAHGADISVLSEESTGTRFKVSLPRGRG